MFSQLMADYDDRVREVDTYFKGLAAFDNEEIEIKAGVGAPQAFPIGPPPADWGRMLKGAAYLVLYNLVEAFIRRGFQEVFEAIKSDGVVGVDLSPLLRQQWIMQKNRRIRAFDGAPKHYMEIANDIVSDIVTNQVATLSRDHLPFSGNLDATAIRDVCDRHGVSHASPAAARGGAELVTVKAKRNSLSHGDESFVECGRGITAAELVKAKDEVVIFIRAILANMEAFCVAKGYRI